ncbi:MAG: hypothetical protein HY978_02090 [Candidatus Liptonbacteria bacterium]|nr:hypothetical protein [Candidatus Liptonbacteria bacterium]
MPGYRAEYPWRSTDRAAGRDMQRLMLFEQRSGEIGQMLQGTFNLPEETARRLERLLFDTAVEPQETVDQIRASEKSLVYHPPYFQVQGVSDSAFRCPDGKSFLDLFTRDKLAEHSSPETLVAGIEVAVEYEMENLSKIREAMASASRERRELEH